LGTCTARSTWRGVRGRSGPAPRTASHRAACGFLFSGEWWILLFPGLTLLALALSVNLVGDWLRDALNPKLQ